MVRPWVTSLYVQNTPIFGRIAGTVAALMAYDAVVVLIDRRMPLAVPEGVAQFHALLGLILGVLLVFRTNTSYDRWWEGRKLWGQLVNDIRNLAIKVQTCVRADVADKQRLGHWLNDFALALKGHLRRGVRLSDFTDFEPVKPEAEPQHVPAYIAARIYEQFETWRQNEQLGGFELLFLDQHAASLMNICGACERIQKSPISPSYRWFIRQLIGFYLLTLPWGLMRSFGWWTVPAAALLAYFMVGVEMIAEQIEDPFGLTKDDLMLDDLCKTIEQSVTDILTSRQAAPESPVGQVAMP